MRTVESAAAGLGQSAVRNPHSEIRDTMSWLALSPAQVAALWSVAALAAVWLYLLQQRPRLRRVSTLRFWQSLEPSPEARRRRKIQQPWALLAQLAFLLLILLALANPRWDGGWEPRHVVLLLDTSVWSQAQPPGETRWIERVRAEALKLIERLPAGDRVLLLRADADAPPVLPFTPDRARLRRAISALQPSDTVADLPRALEFAAAAAAGRPHSVVAYVGPGMLDDSQARRLEELRRSLEQGRAASRPRFLVRLVGAGGSIENRGLTRLALRRDPARPDRWHLLAQLRNYGGRAATVSLRLSVDGRALQEQALWLSPGESVGARAEFTWADGGLLSAEIAPSDALAADNRAIAHLPAFHPVRLAVFTAHPRALQAVLTANVYWRTEFVPPGRTPSARPDVTIYDAVTPPLEPPTHAIFFLHGESARQVRVTLWNPQHPVTRWIRTRDVSVSHVATFQPRPSDTVLAWADRVPLALAREEQGRKTLLVGFDPRQSNFPLQPAFPLLMASAIEWMTGAVEEMADSLTAGELNLAGPARRVFSPSGAELPLARQGRDLYLLALQAGLYRLRTSDRELKVAVNIPSLPFQRWQPTPAEAAELPPGPLSESGRALWQWLVLLALVALWAEWQLFYPSLSLRQGARSAPAAADRGGAV